MFVNYVSLTMTDSFLFFLFTAIGLFNSYSEPIEVVQWSGIDGASDSAKMSQICAMMKPLIIRESSKRSKCL